MDINLKSLSNNYLLSQAKLESDKEKVVDLRRPQPIISYLTWICY